MTKRSGMSDLHGQLAAAEARVEQLRRQINQTSCADVGHSWKFYGGRNAGCRDHCNCSVPVYRCVKCGDYDYGDNEEAHEVRGECALRDQP